jgi:hypothetical protein
VPTRPATPSRWRRHKIFRNPSPRPTVHAQNAADDDRR